MHPGNRHFQISAIFLKSASLRNSPMYSQPPVFGLRCSFLGPPGVTPNPSWNDTAKALSAAALLLSLCGDGEEKQSGFCHADHKRLAEPTVGPRPSKYGYSSFPDCVLYPYTMLICPQTWKETQGGSETAGSGGLSSERKMSRLLSQPCQS